MRNARRTFPALLLFATSVFVLHACVQSSASSDGPDGLAGGGDPAEAEVERAASRGLPTRLLPADFGTPEYTAPRGVCVDLLRDPDKPEVELRLMQQYTRVDEWVRGDTMVTARYAEGVYSVSPHTAYRLEPGQLLRVNCARQAATATLAAME